MLANLGWTLQVMALILVAAALPVGMIYNAVRTEVAMLAVGAGLFLFGRWLQSRAAR